jgi:hypothetical protein
MLGSAGNDDPAFEEEQTPDLLERGQETLEASRRLLDGRLAKVQEAQADAAAVPTAKHVVRKPGLGGPDGS